MTISDFMDYCVDELWQEIKVWDIDKEEYVFKGEYMDIPSDLDFIELQSFENQNGYLCLNI